MTAANGAEIGVSPALVIDAEDAATLHVRCFDEPWQSDLIARVLGTPGGFGTVARRASALVGFVLCRSAGGEGEILTLCVAPMLRQQGIGRMLLEAAIAEAEQRHLDALFLEVAEDNEIARRLYDKHGFVRVGLRSAYYRLASGRTVDALTLRRDLQPRIARN